MSEQPNKVHTNLWLDEDTQLAIKQHALNAAVTPSWLINITLGLAFGTRTSWPKKPKHLTKAQKFLKKEGNSK